MFTVDVSSEGLILFLNKASIISSSISLVCLEGKLCDYDLFIFWSKLS